MDPSPPPVPLRAVADVDVRSVAEALDDGDHDTSWWYDPATGQTETGLSDDMAAEFGDEDDDPSERGLVRIEFAGSRQAYADMVEFAEAVGERRAADLLQRALDGRGAFRRFRYTLEDFPDLRGYWSTYSRAAAEMRAIDWLAAERYVAEADADREVGVRSATQAAVLAAVSHPHGPRVGSA